MNKVPIKYQKSPFDANGDEDAQIRIMKKRGFNSNNLVLDGRLNDIINRAQPFRRLVETQQNSNFAPDEQEDLIVKKDESIAYGEDKLVRVVSQFKFRCDVGLNCSTACIYIRSEVQGQYQFQHQPRPHLNSKN